MFLRKKKPVEETKSMLVVLPDAFHDNATQHAREHLLASLAFQGHQLVDGLLRAEWENLDMKSHFLLLH